MSDTYSSGDPAVRKPKTPRVQPGKPYPTFPLYAHPSGQWAKKIRGRLVYFGRWEDPDGALNKYLEQKDDLHAGRKPRIDPDALTIKDLCNQFLNAKQARVDAGELARLTWGDYKTACDEIVTAFGKSRLVADIGPDDFAPCETEWPANGGRTGSVKTSSSSAA